MNTETLMNRAIEELGVESVVYILLWGVLGLGVGCLVGYTTSHVIKK